jgi:arylsulfatase A-like enzyme
MRNIILILLDGLRGDCIKSSPILNQIAKNNIFFSNMIVSAPYTIASMHSIFSGIYPSRNGVNSYSKVYNFKKSCKTITQYLRDEGYNTIGSICSGLLAPEQGFDKLNIYDENKDDIDDEGIKLLESAKEKFFLHLHPSHLHRNVVKRVIKKYDDFDEEYFNNYEQNKIDYISSISEIDIYLKKIFSKIFELGLEKNSIIFILSDHGTSVGERIGEKAYGNYLYNYTIKTFCVICFPEKISKEIKYRIRSVDIMPTILDLVNINVDNNYEKLDGKSILPFINGEEKGDRTSFSETGKLNQEDITKSAHNLFSVIKGDWKLIFNKKENKFELYNIEKDPNEKNNLIGSNNEIESMLKNELKIYGKDKPQC